MATKTTRPIFDGVGPTLRYLGLAILAASVVLLLAGEAGWVEPAFADRWFLPLAKIGAVCFLVGLALALLARLMHAALRGRCVRCGAATERGQSYCLDHLMETVHEAQDAVRRSESHRGGRR